MLFRFSLLILLLLLVGCADEQPSGSSGSSLSLVRTPSKSSYTPNEQISFAASYKDATQFIWKINGATQTETGKTMVRSFTEERSYEVSANALIDGKEVALTKATFTVSSAPTYPLHTGIIASTFWCGEGASGDNGDITNVSSAWDGNWGTHFGLEDAPLIPRDADHLPTSSSYKKSENPYYFALPYNDYDDVAYDGESPAKVVGLSSDYSTRFSSDLDRNIVVTSAMQGELKRSTSQIPWRSGTNWSGKSMVKARWIRLRVSGTSNWVYAQWGDAGPYFYDDAEYVFGTAQPTNSAKKIDTPFAGIDLSPSVCLALGRTLEEWGADEFKVDWEFVDFANVPDGPWKRYLSNNEVTW